MRQGSSSKKLPRGWGVGLVEGVKDGGAGGGADWEVAGFCREGCFRQQSCRCGQREEDEGEGEDVISPCVGLFKKWPLDQSQEICKHQNLSRGFRFVC